MAFNVGEFRSQLEGDGARPNLFDVSLVLPAILGYAGANQKLAFTCKSASLPGSTVGTVLLQYFGREVKLAGNRTFAPWTVTILNDEDWSVRTGFEKWLNALNSHAGNQRLSGAGNSIGYTVDASVNQYAKTGSSPVATYKFVGLFPTDLSQIDLDWGANDTIEEFTVTFDYQYWTRTNDGAGIV